MIDLDDDADFLSIIDAVEADALASAGKKKRQGTSETIVEIEGSYAAALKGSRSSLWKKQQEELLLPRKKAKETGPSFTAGGNNGGGGGVVSGSGGSDGCFKCGASGHWARDCTAVGGGAEGLGRGGAVVDGAVEDKPCPCGSGNCLVLTSNTAKNPGRKFYRCPLREVRVLIWVSFAC